MVDTGCPHRATWRRKQRSGLRPPPFTLPIAAKDANSYYQYRNIDWHEARTEEAHLHRLHEEEEEFLLAKTDLGFDSIGH